jgi:hypothetical protein
MQSEGVAEVELAVSPAALGAYTSPSAALGAGATRCTIGNVVHAQSLWRELTSLTERW